MSSTVTFRPADPVRRAKWLFTGHPDSATIAGGDYERYDETLARRRSEAVAEVERTAGWDGILRLIDHAEQPETVGWTIGTSPMWDRVDVEAWMTAGSIPRARAAVGFIRGRHARPDRSGSRRGWMSTVRSSTTTQWREDSWRASPSAECGIRRVPG